MNTLAACTFDMRFSYIMAGWEGSAHDSRLYRDALAHGLDIPEGCYLLGDAGIPHANGTMIPWRGVRYHLKEWGNVQER